MTILRFLQYKDNSQLKKFRKTETKLCGKPLKTILGFLQYKDNSQPKTLRKIENRTKRCVDFSVRENIILCATAVCINGWACGKSSMAQLFNLKFFLYL